MCGGQISRRVQLQLVFERESAVGHGKIGHIALGFGALAQGGCWREAVLAVGSGLRAEPPGWQSSSSLRDTKRRRRIELTNPRQALERDGAFLEERAQSMPARSFAYAWPVWAR